MPSQPTYRDLIVWQRADDLFVRLHSVIREHFPRDERFCLSSQLRRAALSVAANIVEETARSHDGEKSQFLRISWGSLQETGYYVHVAGRLGYLNGELREQLERQIREVAAPLSGLMRHFDS